MSSNLPLDADGSAAEPVARRRPATGSLPVTATILVLLAAGFALTVLVFRPGYMPDDAVYVYDYSRSWDIGDWQSPVMVLIWRAIDPIAPGALSMFLLIAALYWAAFGGLALAAARRWALIGLATPFIALAPPAFMFVGFIWRDVLFGAIWLLAAVLPFALVEHPARVRLPAQALSLALIALGVLLRPNAIIAAPLLAGYALWPGCFRFKRAALMFVPAALAFYALVPAVYYGMLHAKRQHPVHSLMVYDLGGISHFTGENQFPVQWSTPETALLTSQCYRPTQWDVYWTLPPCEFVMARLERKDDPIFGTARLTEAWRRAVIAHPLAYVEHRASFMWNFLARPNLVLPYLDWNSLPSSRNPFFRPVRPLEDALKETIVFRAGLWLMLAMAIGVIAWRSRATPPGAFALGVTASAAVYVMTFFAVGVASDFRYAYWCVLAVLAGAVAVMSGRRERQATP